jgi:hypothetical protein
MPISFRLEHVIEEVLSQQPREQRRVLRKLTGRKLSASEANAAWPLILEHKWFLSERLNRDVGLMVAAVDYFENVRPPRQSSRIGSLRGPIPPRLPFMQPLSQEPG